jgi:hypothetical protein
VKPMESPSGINCWPFGGKKLSRFERPVLHSLRAWLFLLGPFCSYPV